MPDVNWIAVALLRGQLAGDRRAVVLARRCSRSRGKARRALSDEQMKSANMAIIFGLAFVLSFIAAAVFAMFLGRDMSVGAATAAGFSAGLCWVARRVGISYLFERRPLKLWLINGGYHTLQFTAFGLILGLMR